MPDKFIVDVSAAKLSPQVAKELEAAVQKADTGAGTRKPF